MRQNIFMLAAQRSSEEAGCRQEMLPEQSRLAPGQFPHQHKQWLSTRSTTETQGRSRVSSEQMISSDLFQKATYLCLHSGPEMPWGTFNVSYRQLWTSSCCYNMNPTKSHVFAFHHAHTFTRWEICPRRREKVEHYFSTGDSLAKMSKTVLAECCFSNVTR